MFEASAFSLAKGIAAGTAWLLSRFKARHGWSRPDILALLSRVSAGIGCAWVGAEFCATQFATWRHEAAASTTEIVLAAALLMGFGHEIVRQIEKIIKAGGKKVHHMDDTMEAPLDTVKPKE